MTIKLFNTLSSQLEPLPTPKGRPLRVFVCGPTVYDDPHIGNARTALTFDAFVKYLRSTGLKVFYLMNVTDVDDKIIARAKSQKTTFSKVAEEFWKVYQRNMKDLGISSVTKFAKATKFIPQIQKQVATLLRKGYAYEIPEDGIYFDVSKFKDYGKLSRRTTEQAEDGVSRIDSSIRKRNKADFALWKISTDDEPGFKSPWGFGRPGWHIEDTAITEYFFGPQYDIHGGGLDLKFPHHEAELAQQEAASGKKPFVKIWMHAGLLSIEGQKMSKSLGNFLTVDQLLKISSANVFRLLVLSHHYRSPLNFSTKLTQEMNRKWLSVMEFLAKIEWAVKNSKEKKLGGIGVGEYRDKIEASLAADFNTPEALGNLFAFIGRIHPKVWKLSKAEARESANLVKNFLKRLGFSVNFPKIPPRIKAIAKEREKLRQSQQFIQSDGLRKKANDLGFVIEDTPGGTFIWPKS